MHWWDFMSYEIQIQQCLSLWAINLFSLLYYNLLSSMLNRSFPWFVIWWEEIILSKRHPLQYLMRCFRRLFLGFQQRRFCSGMEREVEDIEDVSSLMRENLIRHCWPDILINIDDSYKKSGHNYSNNFTLIALIGALQSLKRVTLELNAPHPAQHNLSTVTQLMQL